MFEKSAPFLSISWRAKKEYIRFTVSSGSDRPLAMSRALAIPTGVPPRLNLLRYSRPRRAADFMASLGSNRSEASIGLWVGILVLFYGQPQKAARQGAADA